MKKKFRITCFGDADPNKIILQEQDWEQMMNARSLVYNIYYIEQKYDLMISNYYEFEENLLKQALDRSIWFRNYQTLNDDLLTTARKIINLITSIILYTEHLEKRHIKKFQFGDKSNDKIFGEFKSYLKSSMDYKFIKGLRNYIAHRDLPMDFYSYSSKWEKIGNENDEKLGHYVIPSVEKERLLTDKKFNKSVVKAMESKKGKIDLRNPIRKTIAGISKRAKDLRKSLSPEYEFAKTQIMDAINRYKENLDENFIHCQAEKLIDSEVVETISLSEKMFDRVEVLFERNQSQGILERRYVHNRL
jgi:hypothetical protein